MLEQKNRNVLDVFTSKIGLDFRVLVGSDVTKGKGIAPNLSLKILNHKQLVLLYR